MPWELGYSCVFGGEAPGSLPDFMLGQPCPAQCRGEWRLLCQSPVGAPLCGGTAPVGQGVSRALAASVLERNAVVHLPSLPAIPPAHLEQRVVPLATGNPAGPRGPGAAHAWTVGRPAGMQYE